MSDSLWSEEEQHSQNYDIPEESQKAAARKIRKTGAKVWKDGEVWVVQQENVKVAETVSPRVLVDRAARDYYGEIKEDKPAGTDRRKVQVPRDKGRSNRPVVSNGKQRAEKVDRSSDKRKREQTETRGNGRGSSKASRGSGAGNKKISRKKASPVRQQRQRVSAAKADNRTRKTRVAGRRKPGVDKPKPRPAKRHR